ncbi:MAG: ThuA domain-containing protein [Solirubrobacterales bacterium]
MRTNSSARIAARRGFLGGAAATIGLLATRWLGRAVAQAPAVTAPEDRQRIEAAIPAQAFATPHKPRRLLIFDLNVGYGGHGSIGTANTAFTLMGEKTGAFTTVVSRDPAVFEPESLRQFDAVFFNNTVGNCFDDPGLRRSLVEFVYRGGGLMGVHGTSVAFTKWPGAIEDWPEFGIMLGARGANHKAADEHVFIKLDDPAHPVNQAFGGQGFDYRDEFFRVHEPYSRNRVRVLLSIDTQKTDMQQEPIYGAVVRPDNDYALAWVRQYGLGRIFYCGFAHHPSVFWDPKMLQFYLAAVQFALGDLPGPTTPSAKLTPAIRAQEQLGWRLVLTPSSESTLFETIDKAAGLGVLYVGGSSSQKVSGDIPRQFDEQLSDDERREIRLKLDAAGVRLLTYHGGREPSSQRLEFARTMGVETVIADAMPPGVVSLDEAAGNNRIESLLDDLHRRHPRPMVFTIGTIDGLAQHIEAFNQASVRLANGGKS